MTVSSAMNIAVSALKAQSQALSVISNNLANSGTTGYKSVTTSFSALVTQAYSGTSYNGAGVTSAARQNVSNQGTISATSTSTDLALDGNGMFVVSAGDTDSLYFTRNGEFDQDKEGFLINGNYYLLGWETDAAGNIIGDQTQANLSKINVTNNVSSVTPTTTATIDANLGPTSLITDTTAVPPVTTDYTSSMEVYDSLGTLHTVGMTWTKTATNEWEVAYSCDDGTVTSGSPVAMTFDGSGKLLTPTATQDLEMTWTTGADPSTIAVDFSSMNQTYGKTGIDATSVATDGHSYGKLTSVAIADDGTVTANYDNGEAVAIYKVAVATFPNEDGLTALSHGVYQKSGTSGSFTLHVAGDGGSGVISASALESSTVDTADEFTKMIVAQQAYSAASQVITTSKDMYDALISAVR